jgi:hypothetical protein
MPDLKLINGEKSGGKEVKNKSKRAGNESKQG